MRQQVAVLVLAGMSTLAIACTTTLAGKAVPGDNSGPLTRNSVTVSALDGLLLDVGHIETALGATSMKVWFNAKAMWDWSSSVDDKNCLAIDGPAQDKVHANTGWTAMRGQRLDDSVDDSKKRKNYATMVTSGQVTATDGAQIAVGVESVCVHGDSPGVVQIATSVRDRLEAAGADIRAFC